MRYRIILPVCLVLLLMTTFGVMAQDIHHSVKSGDVEKVKALIKTKPALIHAKDEAGFTPLMLAVKLDNAPMLEMLLSCGADINEPDNSGNTPLHITVNEGLARMVDLLIKKRASLKAVNEYDISPLHLSENCEISRALIRAGADVNIRDRFGATPLHYAVDKDIKEIVKLLISSGADVNAADKRKWTPLHFSANNNSLDAAELLLKNGARMDPDDAGQTPLFIAVNGQFLDFAEKLLAAGAAVNTHDVAGKTPLLYAVEKGYADMATLLLSKGAAVNSGDAQSLTPLHAAIKAWQPEIAKLLIDHGAAVDAKDAERRTPLHYTAVEGSVEAAAMLVEKGADCNERDCEGRTPLHLAILEANPEVAEFLLHKGADSNCRDYSNAAPLDYMKRMDTEEREKTTPLHWAAAKGHKEVVELLISAGLDKNKIGEDGGTPLNWALKENRQDMADMLAAGGAKRAPLSRGSLSERTVIISDTHVGASKAALTDLKAFMKYLRNDPPARLVLNGDIVEFWLVDEGKAYANARDFVQKYICPLMQQGTSVEYVIGNHDYTIHKEIARLYEKGGDKAVEELFRRLGLSGAHPLFHIRYPYYVLRPDSGRGKSVTIMHGDVVDLMWAFKNISSLKLKDTTLLGKEDDKFRQLLKSVQMKDVFILYDWIARYPEKATLIAADDPFSSIPVNMKVSLFFDFILSPLPRSILERARIKISRNPLMLGAIPFYHREILDFVQDTVKMGFAKMGKRTLDALVQQWHQSMFGKEKWWKFYMRTGEDRITSGDLSYTVIGHVHRVGHAKVENSNFFSDGGWYHGQHNDSGIFIEIEGGQISIRKFTPPARVETIESIDM